MNRVRLWLRSIVLRRRLEREMQEEMAGHLERATERLLARGLSAEEARRQAMREFGNIVYLQEEGRLARGTGWVDALTADLRYAMRQFARKPAATLTIIAVLAVGISLATSLFSFLHSYAVQPPLGVVETEGLVRIRGSYTRPGDRGFRHFSTHEFEQYRRLNDPFSEVAGVDERCHFAYER